MWKLTDSPVSRAAAQIGQLLAGELIHIGAVQAELAPPDAQAVDHAGAGALGDFRLDAVFAALVEDLDDAVAEDAARGGVLLVHFQHRFALDVAQALHVDKCGVQKVARRRRNQRQRKPLGRAGYFVIGHVGRQAA